MKRGGRIARKTPLRAKGGRRFTEGNDPDFLRWLAGGRRCLVAIARPEFETECEGGIDPAHIDGRAHTGQDRRNSIPLCRFHHRRQDDVGWSLGRWLEHYRLTIDDLLFWAEAFAQVYERKLARERGEQVEDLPF